MDLARPRVLSMEWFVRASRGTVVSNREETGRDMGPRWVHVRGQRGAVTCCARRAFHVKESTRSGVACRGVQKDFSRRLPEQMSARPGLRAGGLKLGSESVRAVGERGLRRCVLAQTWIQSGLEFPLTGPD